MGVNRNKPDFWKADIIKSVDMYNNWFINFAPKAYRETRIKTTKDVEKTLKITNNLEDIKIETLQYNPSVLPTLRMSTCPPLAVDRLIGLAGVSKNLVLVMEQGKLPPRMKAADLNAQLHKISDIIEKMVDPDIFIWRGQPQKPSEPDVYRAATIIADRLCGSVANPIIRNAQEKRQLAAIEGWLQARGYTPLPAGQRIKFNEMPAGTYAFRLNVQIDQENGSKTVNIPVDAVVMSKQAKTKELPLLIEAKSAGDFTNVNKRRKEEAVKISQLRSTYLTFLTLFCSPVIFSRTGFCPVLLTGLLLDKPRRFDAQCQ